MSFRAKKPTKKILLFASLLLGLISLILLLPPHPRSNKPLGPGPMHKGQTTESWVSQIWFANPQMNPAINEVATIGAPAVPYIVARLENRSPGYTHGKTYWYLWQHAPAGIQSKMRRPPPSVQDEEKQISALEYTLGSIGPDAKDAVPSLIRILKNKEISWSPRMFALQALGAIGTNASAATPYIIDCLKDDHLHIRQQYFANSGVGYDSTADQADRTLRTRAAMALIQIGAHDAEALPPIRVLLADTNAFNRSTAIVALWALDPQPANFELVKAALLSIDADLQRSTAAKLGVVGNRAAPFKPLLEELLTKTNPTNQLHQEIRRTLSKIKTLANSNTAATP
jgi:hypothetical protein